MPALFQGRPGFDDIVDIDWPRTAESVPHGLMLLRNQLHSHLGIAGGSAADSAARIAAALNGGDRPRAFYCELRDSFFTPLQHDLLLAWLAEWGRMADAGLNDLVTMFVCLVFDAAPQPPPRWKFWAAPQVLLRDVAREYFGTADAMRDHRRLRLVRLSQLGPCERRRHLPEWRDRLSARPPYRWLGDHVTTVHMKIEQDVFPLGTLLTTLERLAQPPAAPRS